MNDQKPYIVENIKITGLNKRGEGLGVSSCGPITIPFALENETARVQIIETKDKTWGKVVEITEPSENRITAVCQHYGTCGGCGLQHLNDQAYRSFKKRQVTNPMTEYGLDPAIVQDPIILGPALRRRIDFLTRKYPDGMTMGYYEINARRRINLKSCPVVDPRIDALIGPLEVLLDKILEMRELVHIFILAADNGIDLLLAGFKREIDPDTIQTLRDFAEAQNLARLTYKIKRQAHIIYEREAPYVTFGGYRMGVDPNVFLQASPKADQILSQLVVDALPPEARFVADLFCGRGTLSLPILSSGRYVYGYEGDKHAITALRELDAPGLDPQVRDLFASPLTAGELKPYHAVVLNPPRSGVKGQITTVAEARTPTVVYVSCNPETFAKDMAELCSNGYKLEKVTPVDQFMWSHHVEVVGVAKLTDG